MEKRERSGVLRYLRHVAMGALFAGALATPALPQEPGDYPVAEEPNGYPIADVNLRAGPGTDYPVLLTVPTNAPITILGCLENYTWCDTVYEGSRGWMSSIYLAGYYDGQYYLLKDYAPDLGYQTVTFDVAAYWDTYYRDQPFYNDQYRVSSPRGEDYVDDGVFYDRLSPYGSWTWTQGQYVWVPNAVDASWRPYTRGRWIYTSYGWTWVSDEPFGWATYHYGRWGYSGAVGWFWVPGNRWGPAWVSWRQSDDYLAWAPLPPAYGRGVSVSISFGSIPNYYWSVVPSRYFLSRDLPRYYVHDRARWRFAYDRTRPIGHTTIVNNTVVNNIVNVKYVQQHTSQTVVERNVVRTRDFNRAGRIQGNAFEVYRPGLREGRGRFAPENPRRIDQVAAASRNNRLADGQPTTDNLMAPQAVRDAVENRRRGHTRGEQFGPRDGGRNGAREASLGRGLPRGREAEGPPPASKKARARPVPATDLGPGSRGPNTERRGPRPPEAVSRSGPQNDARPNGAGPGSKPGKAGREGRPGGPNGQASQDRKPPMQAKERPGDQKAPPQVRARQEEKGRPDRSANPRRNANQGPAKANARANPQNPPAEKRHGKPDGKAASRGPSKPPAKSAHPPKPAAKSAAPQVKPDKKKTASPQAKPDKSKEPNQAARKKPEPSTRSAPATRGPVADRKPPSAKTKQNAKKGPGGQDAKPHSQRPPAQARQTKPKPSAKAASDEGANPAPKRTPPKAKPKEKSPPKQNANAKKPPAKPKPQARSKKPPEQGKPKKKSPSQAQHRKPPPKAKSQARSKPPQAKPKKKSPPKQSASARKPPAKPKPQARSKKPQPKAKGDEDKKKKKKKKN